MYIASFCKLHCSLLCLYFLFFVGNLFNGVKSQCKWLVLGQVNLTN